MNGIGAYLVISISSAITVTREFIAHDVDQSGKWNEDDDHDHTRINGDMSFRAYVIIIVCTVPSSLLLSSM